jgi:hypothetical protein
MTDDQTHQYDSNPGGEAPAPDAAPAADPAAAAADPAPATADLAPATAAATAPATAMPDAVPAAATTTTPATVAPDFAPAAASPMTPVAAAGGSRTRWFVAIGVAVVAIGAAIAAFLLLNSPKSPEALAYVPADAALVVELRPELPGDQLQQLGNLLAHFPGFADQSTLNQKIDTALSQLFARAGDGIDYTTRVKPWLNGPAFIAVTPKAVTPTPSGGAGAAPDANVLISATTTGQITCALTLQGQTTTPETYNGTELLFVSGQDLGCAIQGRQGLLGNRAALHAALDAKAGGSGMDKSAGYTKARSSLKAGDRLATMYANLGKYMDLLKSAGGAIPGASNPFDAMNVKLPEWAIAGIRAEGDALVMDSAAPVVAASSSGASLLPAVPAHASVLSAMVPADAVAYVEAQGAGVSLQNLIAQLRTIPEVDQQLNVIDGMASMSTLVGWIQDAGIVVTGGDSPAVSVLLLAADDATAAEKGGSLGTLIGLLQVSGGQGISVTDETVNGVKITTVTIADVGALTGSAGVPGATGPVKISFGVKGRAIMFGVGEGALTKLVNVQAGSTLADDAAFKKVAARGVSPSAATVYVAIPKLVELVEGQMPAADLADWNTNVKPFIAPLEAFYFVSEMDGDLGESTAILTVKSK